jgi:oxalate decarboxylase/phosphoglucose isomerase-like protein (cupin superfamily)
MVDDWISHTPKDVLAKNFGLNASVFGSVPAPNPYILNGTVSTRNVTDGPAGTLSGNSSFVYRTLQHPAEKVPGGGGEFHKIDSTNFPVAKTLAATYVRLEPKGLRELHWHPNVSSTDSC